MYGHTDGWTENLPILQDFVLYRGRCRKSGQYAPELKHCHLRRETNTLSNIRDAECLAFCLTLWLAGRTRAMTSFIPYISLLLSRVTDSSGSLGYLSRSERKTNEIGPSSRLLDHSQNPSDPHPSHMRSGAMEKGRPGRPWTPLASDCKLS